MPVERSFEEDLLGNVLGDRCPKKGSLMGVLRGEVSKKRLEMF